MDQGGLIRHEPPTPGCSFKVEGIPRSTQKSSNSTDYDDDEALAVMQSLAGVEVRLKQDDNYSIAPSDEEDMARLVDSFSAAGPPPNVMQGIVYDSANEAFDSTRPGSSPRDTPPEGLMLASDGKPFVKAESLDHDVEWDDVLELLPSLPKDPSLSDLPTATAPAVGTSVGWPLAAKPKPMKPTSNHQMPFKRPPFPSPLLEKSPVAGLTNTSVLRICFRIGEMINEGCRRYNSQQDVTFELYARVTYSSREATGRKQNFQFMDLFKEQLPYPTGALTGWRTGSLLDQQSAVFLTVGTGQMKMCRCICKLERNRKAEMGWAVVVLAIREVDWDEIEMMKMLVCRE
ncbi:hypothetical protein B0T19DRAFT_438884 [Cercophora scortea]|uniref:Uncharacterized protein n=1 Tax=Cercophora scortea TaxID=314031 RepID=A0AAE0IW25_9PEZI|nr:hypothetical protein B0T19DRAFT_438884 [Cercophora scortea]